MLYGPLLCLCLHTRPFSGTTKSIHWPHYPKHILTSASSSNMQYVVAKIKQRIFPGASFFTISRNKIPVKISTYMVSSHHYTIICNSNSKSQWQFFLNSELSCYRDFTKNGNPLVITLLLRYSTQSPDMTFNMWRSLWMQMGSPTAWTYNHLTYKPWGCIHARLGI